MTRQTLLTFGMALLSAATLLLLPANSGGRAASANVGNTGAPGESGQTCGSCHNGGGFGPVSGSLAVQESGIATPVSSYVPGLVYDITLTTTASGSPSGYGFQMTALDGADAEVGTWSAPASNVQIETASAVGGRTYVEHNGVTSSPVFSVQWTAPSAGTGTVTFYFGGNAVNLNNSSSGDNVMPSSTFSLSESGAPTALGETLSPVNLSVFPNPVTQGRVTLQGAWLAAENPSLDVLDASGRMVLQLPSVPESGTIALPSSASGALFLRFQTPDRVHTERILVAPGQ